MSFMTQLDLATALMQRLLSTVRDVIGNFTYMLKPWGGEKNFPFSIRMRQWWPPQHKGGVRTSVFPCQKVRFSCSKEA